MKFKYGDNVYHKTLKWYGTFMSYTADPTSAIVEFIDDKGYHDTREISHNLLINADKKEDEMPNIKTCENCKWVGCRNYGHNLPACTKHILETRAEK